MATIAVSSIQFRIIFNLRDAVHPSTTPGKVSFLSVWIACDPRVKDFFYSSWFVSFCSIFFSAILVLTVCNLLNANHCSAGGTFGGRQGGSRRDHSLVGTTVKIRIGPFKGYRGRVIDATDSDVRIELESQMKVVTGDSNMKSFSFCVKVLRHKLEVVLDLVL